MWIFIKLSITVLAFFYKFFAKTFNFSSSGDAITVKGIPCYVGTTKGKYGKILSTHFKVKFDSKYIFKFTKESWFDRLMKSLGIAIEIQSGNSRFDQHVYVASDSRSFMQKVCYTPEVQALITQLFINHEAKYISSNGKTIKINFSGDVQNNTRLMEKFVELFLHIAKIKIRSPYSFDSFAVKALVLESLVWSTAVYSIMGFIEFTFHPEDIHLHEYSLFIQGLFTGMIIAIALIMFVIILMRGSSRGHRLILESILLLLFSLPFGGYNIVSDLNTKLDRAAPVIEEAMVINHYKRLHRGRRGRKYFTYHIQIDQFKTQDIYNLDRDIKITSDDFTRVQNGDTVKIEIGPGWLKHPWYRSFNFSRP
ncbi:MAG: hypothetical protein KDD46_07920 [Bdellovibrionales bacterium]|nr:hypothetical protein [Bdellovibrionales bacterium]